MTRLIFFCLLFLSCSNFKALNKVQTIKAESTNFITNNAIVYTYLPIETAKNRDAVLESFYNSLKNRFKTKAVDVEVIEVDTNKYNSGYYSFNNQEPKPNLGIKIFAKSIAYYSTMHVSSIYFVVSVKNLLSDQQVWLGSIRVTYADLSFGMTLEDVMNYNIDNFIDQLIKEKVLHTSTGASL